MKGRPWYRKAILLEWEREKEVLACVSTDFKVHFTDILPFISAEVNKAILEALYKKL